MIRTVPILFLFSLLTIAFFSNCGDKAPIEEEKFIKVYVDLLAILDTTSSSQANLDSLKATVFNRHNITAENYKNTIDHYNSSPEKWEEFFNKATAYVEKLKQKAAN